MRVAASLWQVAVFWAAACSRLSAAQVPDTPDAPSPDKFLRRIQLRAAVIGNYIYFDGGAVNKENITEDLSIRTPARAVGSTLSIDLTQRWSPETVVMKATAKPEGQPLMNSGGIFVNPGGQGSFYVYGGIQTFVTSPPSREDLWKFRADGNGSGTWITETPSNGNFFNDMVRTSFGAWASTPGAGFWIGGEADERTSRNTAVYGPRGDILSYNFTDNSWAEHPSVGLSPDGTLYGASATFVPTFGPNGIIVVLGGTSQYEQPGEGHQPMDDIRFFDPVTKEVFRQKTSGSQVPSERRHQCAVGAEGPDNTYEIFIYGGENLLNKERPFDEVWVLSLPGFFWTKAGYEAEFPRVGHDCVAAGNRQLVSIGGFDNSNGRKNAEWWRVKDNFPQGLGVFDLTELSWKDSFDPDAAAYESPEAVKAWYKDNNVDDITWASDSVRALFLPSPADPPGSGGGNSPGTGDNNSGNDENKDKDEVAGGTPNPVAAIAGGVVGGVIGVAIAGAIFWFCRRRRRQSRQVEDSQQTHALQGGYKPPHSPAGDMFTDTPHASSSGHTPSPAGWYGQPAPGSGHPGYAVQPQSAAQEVPKAELQGNSFVHEMDGTSVPPRHY